MLEPSVGVNQWPVETARVPYPFTDISSLKDSSGLLQLQSSWITDARMWPANASSRIYLKSVARDPLTLVFTIASLDAELCSAVVKDFTKRRVALLDTTGNQVGFLAFGPGGLQGIHDVPTGTYRFPIDAAEFVASAVASQAVAGVQGVKDAAGSLMTGDLIFVGGEGVSLHVIGTGNTLRIDVIGSPFFRRDNCVDADFLGRVINPVRFITWDDTTNKNQGVARPKGGNIGTAISTTKATRRRGFVTPGEGMSILGMLGP